MSQSQSPRSAPAARHDDQITEEIHRLRRLLKAKQYRAYADGPRDTVYMGVRLLEYIGAHPGCTQADIVGYFVRDRGQVAKLIGSLRKRDLVNIEQDPSDRRLQRLFLTDDGQKIRRDSQRERKHVARIALKGIDEAEQTFLIELLQRIRQNLEDI